MPLLLFSSCLLLLGSPTVSTLDGKSIALVAPKNGVLAIVFYSSECPISNELSPQLIEIAKSFPTSKLKLVGISVDFDRSLDELRLHAREHLLNYPCTLDRTGDLVKQFGGSMTPEAVVVDDSGKIRYRGRINDIYNARGKRNANPSTHEFRDAIQLVLDGKPVPAPWPKAIGCPIPEYPGR